MDSSAKSRVFRLFISLFLGIAVFLGSIFLLNYYSAEQHSLFYEPYKEKLYTSRKRPSIASAVSVVGNSLANGKGRSWSTAETDPLLNKPGGAVYLALRHKGKRLTAAWYDGGTWEENLEGAMSKALNSLDAKNRNSIDTVELNLSFNYQEVDLSTHRAFLSDLHRGVLGIELVYGTRTLRYAPTEMIAENLSFLDVLREFKENYRAGSLGKSGKQAGFRTRFFDADQIIVNLAALQKSVGMTRGNTLVHQSEVTRENIVKLAERMGQWLIREVDPSGRIEHQYFPSKDSYAPTNNSIRQFMASRSLLKLAAQHNKEELWQLCEKNIRYNLQTFYVSEGPVGFIEYDNKRKLGAAAIAAIALLEYPENEKFEDTLVSLSRFIDHLWQEDGSFRTFYKSTRNDNQNFYPGEALLFWAMLYGREPGQDELLKKFMKSFSYYQRWHRLNRHPAFVPWHTQAYLLLWQQTRDHALAESIFEMNDWMLEMQQWERVLYEDSRGRFYNPGKPLYGPPHAASTGMYLESLIAAFELARELGDSRRETAYRRAIIRGLRSLLQLQFQDDIDMFYISDKDKVRGALRTTVYDNVVRIDNVQQNLMAVLKVLKVFGSEDYLEQ